jgi:hypothetical protein
MATAKEQLLANMNPQMARLLDNQMRDQQVAQRSQGAGMLAGLTQAYTGMGDMAARALGAAPMGANEMQAVQAQQAQEAEQAKAAEQLTILKQQAKDSLYANESLGGNVVSNLLKAVDKDPTGKYAQAVLNKYGLPDIPEQNAKTFGTVRHGDSASIIDLTSGEVVQTLSGEDASNATGGVANPKQEATKLEDYARTRITNMTTDKSLTPETRGFLQKEISTYRESNPNATFQSVATHLSGKLVDRLDLENVEQADKARKMMNTDMVHTLNTIDTILENAEDVGEWEYLILQEIPGAQAKDVKANLKTLFAKISFDRLQRMREESKTGGALGNVSNHEIGLLQNSLRALDPTSDSFEGNLRKVKQHYETIMLLYSGNEETARSYIGKSPDYLLDEETGQLYYTRDNPNDPQQWTPVASLGNK